MKINLLLIFWIIIIIGFRCKVEKPIEEEVEENLGSPNGPEYNDGDCDDNDRDDNNAQHLMDDTSQEQDDSQDYLIDIERYKIKETSQDFKVTVYVMKDSGSSDSEPRELKTTINFSPGLINIVNNGQVSKKIPFIEYFFF